MQKGLLREASSIACLRMRYFFLLVSLFIFEVSVIILLEVSIGAVVVVSGVTVVLSLVSELLPLLLQAAKADTIIAIANNFFICRILRLLTIDLGFIPPPSKR